MEHTFARFKAYKGITVPHRGTRAELAQKTHVIAGLVNMEIEANNIACKRGPVYEIMEKIMNGEIRPSSRNNRIQR